MALIQPHQCFQPPLLSLPPCAVTVTLTLAVPLCHWHRHTVSLSLPPCAVTATLTLSVPLFHWHRHTVSLAATHYTVTTTGVRDTHASMLHWHALLLTCSSRQCHLCTWDAPVWCGPATLLRMPRTAYMMAPCVQYASHGA